MPARFASRLANERAVPPPSLFPSRSLGAIGSPIPQLHEMRKASRQALQKRHPHPVIHSDLIIWATARQDLIPFDISAGTESFFCSHSAFCSAVVLLPSFDGVQSSAIPCLQEPRNIPVILHGTVIASIKPRTEVLNRGF